MKRMNVKLFTLFAAALVFYGCEKEDDLLESTSTANHVMEENCDVINFETREAGTGEFISEISTESGFTVSIYNKARNSMGDLALENRAILFDSDAGQWTGDDDDLVANWGNVLIIQEIGVNTIDTPEDDYDGPNDNQWGGEMQLVFEEPVTLYSMGVIDIDNGIGGPNENDSWVYLYDMNGVEIYKVKLEPKGDNSTQTVDLGATEGVVTMKVVFSGTEGNIGSGAIDDIRFCVPEHGCTRTQGYWKTHSGISKGKGNNNKYDATWDEFLNATIGGLGSYREVLWMEPKGDARIILAHQFIAAELNIAAGASISGDAWDAWIAAKTYFSGGDTDATRAELLTWAETLADYNEGEIGPGHCDD